MEKTRLRIRFGKRGDLRWISHRDLARVWERLLRRANLKLAFSEGFHPKPKISFPSALALGVEALDEVVELELLGAFSIDQVEADIRQQLPVGMELNSIVSLDHGTRKAKVIAASYQLTIPESRCEELQKTIQDLLDSGQVSVQRDEKKTVTCQVTDPNFGLTLDEYCLLFRIPNASDGALKPVEILQLLGVADLVDDGATLQRVKVHLDESVNNQLV